MMISLTLKWIFTMLNANRAPERLKAVRPCKRGEKEEVWEPPGTSRSPAWHRETKHQRTPKKRD